MPRRPSPKPAARSADKTPRRRRDVAVVREAILDAAEHRMIAVGPAGMRLQDVAADVGISHPNVLHHFGSRQALVSAVTARALDVMHAQIIEAIVAASVSEDHVSGLFEKLFAVLSKRGQARMIFWLALEGQTHAANAVSLADVVDAAHEKRRQHAGKKKVPSKEDTGHLVLLAALALTGGAVMWPSLPRNMGMASDEAAGARFRTFLAQLLIKHMGFDA